MVKITHSIGNLKLSKNTKEDVSFIITNNQGSYTFLGDNPLSKYQGFYVFENTRMFKFIDNIKLIPDGKILEIVNKFNIIKRKRQNIVETFFMPKGYNTLIYELSKNYTINLFLDVKESYDNREWGRHYDISIIKDTILISFVKKTDHREDKSHNKVEYERFLAIKVDSQNYEKIFNWELQEYSLDKIRQSYPDGRYVLNAIKLQGKKFVFSASSNKNKALEECKIVFKNSNKLIKKNINENIKLISSLKKIRRLTNKEEKISYLCALNSLLNLSITQGIKTKIIAGLPWFYQSWARDELISLKALDKKIDSKSIFNIISKNLQNINIDGSLNTHFQYTIKSADALGWLFLRINNFKLSVNSKTSKEKIKKIADNIILKQTINNFAINKSKETWMDSIDRANVRIEIQALRLNNYQILNKFTKTHIYEYLENKLLISVKKNFWNGEYLFDGLNDSVIRPNVFIAYYAYPKLLTNDQWTKCFIRTLNSLWLIWGGLSTIDKNNSGFIDSHTGENSKSYHNGDSWFWINNLSALCLFRLNKKLFKKYISRILKASTTEILWKGAIGHHAELSSASKLKSQGCLMQAWSDALFIELIEELHK